jgi:hypothetical protein
MNQWEHSRLIILGISQSVYLARVAEKNGKIQNEVNKKLKRLQNFVVSLKVYYGIKI